jgi:ABC-2 type transport system permease protein
MLTTIARFEFRYVLRNPLLWVTAALTFALFFLAMAIGGFLLGAEGGVLENAAVATLRDYQMISVLFMFVSTAFVANVIIRDDETGFGPIIRATPVTKFEYLFGRYLGAVGVAALCLLLVWPAIWFGSAVSWADPDTIGPNRLANHLFGYLVIALPNLLIHSAVFFALATITRSMMATYLGVIGFLFGFFYLQESFGDRPLLRKLAPYLDPFAGRALKDSVGLWTIAERNVNLPPLAGPLLHNRLIWLGIALVCLVIAYATFRFADQGMSQRERKRQKLVEAVGDPSTALGMTQGGLGMTQLPAAKHDSAALRALLWLRTKFEMKQVFMTPAFPVLMAWGLWTTIFFLITQRDPDGRPSYPTTLSLIPEIEDSFRVIPMVIAIYYAGELVWRERDRRMHELVDAAPIPNWAYVVPKTLAMALVLMSTLLATVVAAVAVQLSLGYTQLELDQYLLWYVLPKTWDMLLLAAVAVFVQSLSPHKAVGWGVMVLFLAWQESSFEFPHDLLNFGEGPSVPLSDLNGAGSFWIGAWTFRVYWGALAMLLLLVAHLLWRRGTELRLMPRIARGLRALAGAPGWVGAAALLTFAATGAYAYYNTNVLNDFQTKTAGEEAKAEFERKFRRYEKLPQPSIVHVTLDMALYPEERRAVTAGRYLLKNETTQPIADLHVRLAADDLELTEAALAGARLIFDDPKHNYRIYRLAQPLQPGQQTEMTFKTTRWHRGFRNNNPAVRLVENGTFLTQEEFMPVFGLGPGNYLQDPKLRQKYGLKGDAKPLPLEDLSGTTKSGFEGWTTADITISTSEDQTPIAPGRKVADIKRGGRRIARYLTEEPIAVRFSVQSARYAEKHRRHRGVDLAVYYHPKHPWNVDKMLDGMALSLDYYQSAFGPYPFDHLRIVEFPGYGYYAQAFAGTVAYSETLDFVADFSDPSTIDHVTLVTAHEVAHQYWGHMVTPSDNEGGSMIVETLAQYSALMAVTKLYGEAGMSRARLDQLVRYLQGRAWAAEESPLMRATGQNFVIYRKGAVVMHLLQERLGEEAINRALRKVIRQYGNKRPPYPRSVDIIAAFRAEAKTEEQQQLITDLFERITLYDFKVDKPSAVRRADGKWDVTVPVVAKKTYSDGKGGETETPLNEHVDVGLFSNEDYEVKHAMTIQRLPIRSGRQTVTFVTANKPFYAGIDPYILYVDRDPGNNIEPVQ